MTQQTEALDELQSTLASIIECSLYEACIQPKLDDLRAAIKSKHRAPIPDILFDGPAVYKALGKAQGRTSPENVCDVLDAAVRLLRASLTATAGSTP